MKISIEFKNSKWLVNDKPFHQLNIQERLFMDSFFREVKTNSLQLESFLLNENKALQQYNS